MALCVAFCRCSLALVVRPGAEASWMRPHLLAPGALSCARVCRSLSSSPTEVPCGGSRRSVLWVRCPGSPAPFIKVAPCPQGMPVSLCQRGGGRTCPGLLCWSPWGCFCARRPVVIAAALWCDSGPASCLVLLSGVSLVPGECGLVSSRSVIPGMPRPSVWGAQLCLPAAATSSVFGALSDLLFLSDRVFAVGPSLSWWLVPEYLSRCPL